ncbi:histidine phosphatase family protein [Halobacillus fulvus]|nr:histidine phosphatase family protein [Halobacillus fulvus]
MKLTIVRHGSTHWNKEKRAQGTSNIPLDQDGRKEASLLASRLSKQNWNVIYSSPLQRAKDTAEIIADKIGGAIIEDERLQEVNGGQIEGTTEEERIEKWGPDWRSLDVGIEKPELVRERAIRFLHDLKQNHPGENVLIVSHGALISHMLQELTGQDEFQQHIKNTAVTEVEWREGKWECLLLNCVDHLPE